MAAFQVVAVVPDLVIIITGVHLNFKAILKAGVHPAR